MAAYLVCVTESEWDVLKGVLSRCEEGAILVPPGVQEALRQKLNLDELPDGDLIDYDFGGEADVYLDVLTDVDSGCALNAIRDHVIHFWHNIDE
jgi:hypothetical protein